ncbi:hypothetical protein AZE42_02816 [Rhizopogon vesiculosus]|uniref:Uncharacterized protein n=1 Tax=Rhizopogon vesiculosus TaxID=180088 RepID=A0A1J8QFG2_9AGAM|nr:hypothetical protein AZE42_02816 [Rhizopogon vesiculosus]
MWPLRISGSPSSSCDSGSKGLNRFVILEPVTKYVDNAFGGYYEESSAVWLTYLRLPRVKLPVPLSDRDLGDWAHYRSTGVWASCRMISGKAKQPSEAVINALKPSQDSAGQSPALHVVNGMSTTTSSIITTAARENVYLSPVDGLQGRLGNSTIRLGGGLAVHPEGGKHDNDDPAVSLPRPSPRPTNPSLATLEKAVSARYRIYFENLYFPLLRWPSREQRRVTMEKDTGIMRLTEDQKEALRARWH